MNYPTQLSTPSDFNIAQISDLHLSKHDKTSFDKFLAVLDLALTYQPDLLLLTGDLVNDGTSGIYDWLFTTLKKTNIPFLCMAGNHDVTKEIGHDLPFDESTLVALMPDKRLIDRHRLMIHTPNTTWQLLAISSAVGGQAYGNVSQDSLQFLSDHLQAPHPTIIALHHHALPVGSAWIDKLMLNNADELWQCLRPHSHLRAVLSGHVHQAHAISAPMMTDTTFYTSPATARQFLPFNEDFALDTMAGGFRLISLNDNQTLHTHVARLP